MTIKNFECATSSSKFIQAYFLTNGSINQNIYMTMFKRAIMATMCSKCNKHELTKDNKCSNCLEEQDKCLCLDK
jgi:hypothetical protein